MILVYHHVCPANRVPAVPIRYAAEGWYYNITPDAFRFQLQTVISRGFRFVTLDEYVHEAVDEDRGPGRMVTVTFDDGWVDNYEFAWPILREMEIPATWFVVSGRMEGVPEASRFSATVLNELAGAGMTIGAHTRTHPNLTTLSAKDLRDELTGCRADLENESRTSIKYLAYPGGRFDDAVMHAAKAAGYHAACSVEPAGLNDRRARYRLSRDVFTPSMDGLRDRMLLNPGGRSLWRAARTARSLFRRRGGV